MRDVNLSQENLAVQWQYVKRNLKEMGVAGNFDDFERRAHRTIQNLMQSDIYEEFAEQIKAKRYEHAPLRIDNRKGEYQRYFTTTFGTSLVNIPVARDGTKIKYKLFDRYQRRQKKFDDTVVLSMILGLSTRKQHKFFKAFVGDAVSHGTASKLLKNLEGDLAEYRTRPIEDKYKYLLIDGLWVSVMSNGHLRKMVILFVLGITLDNKKEIIAFKLAKGETEQEVSGLLNDIYRRGLEGKHVKVVASDGAQGIKQGIVLVYPYAKWQLCHTHKLRNLSSNIQHKTEHRRRMMAQASRIYRSESRRQAIKRFERFCDKWRSLEPKAIRCLEKDFYDTIVYYDFFEDKNFISTTNHIERDLEEVRRRIKTQGYFKSEQSLNLWIYGIISQFREDEREDMPKYMFTLIKVPKNESVQLS
ncbi:MAG: IS256 family transposase [Candidatus Omnitrophota bacterium]